MPVCGNGAGTRARTRGAGAPTHRAAPAACCLRARRPSSLAAVAATDRSCATLQGGTRLLHPAHKDVRVADHEWLGRICAEQVVDQGQNISGRPAPVAYAVERGQLELDNRADRARPPACLAQALAQADLGIRPEDVKRGKPCGTPEELAMNGERAPRAPTQARGRLPRRGWPAPPNSCPPPPSHTRAARPSCPPRLAAPAPKSPITSTAAQ